MFILLSDLGVLAAEFDEMMLQRTQRSLSKSNVQTKGCPLLWETKITTNETNFLSQSLLKFPIICLKRTGLDLFCHS